MKNSFFFCSFFLILTSHTQTIVWQDDFEIPSAWTLNVQSGLNGPDANLWVISDAEGGMPAGSCGIATNGNKTLHIGCQGTWCVGVAPPTMRVMAVWVLWMPQRTKELT